MYFVVCQDALEARARKPSARSPIDTLGTRAHRSDENSTIAWCRKIYVFPQLVPIPISGHSHMSVYALSNEPLLAHTYARVPRSTYTHARTHARVSRSSVYKYNETCPPHNIMSLLARDID